MRTGRQYNDILTAQTDYHPVAVNPATGGHDMPKTTKTTTVTAAAAAKAVKDAGIVAEAKDDAYRNRVAFVLAHRAAERGKADGNKMFATVADILVQMFWNGDKSWGVLLDAYTATGGPEGTFRPCYTMANMVREPKGKVSGINRFRHDFARAVANNDNAADQSDAVVSALQTLKGSLSWAKFRASLKGEDGNNGKTRQRKGDETVTAAVAAYQDGIDPETGASNHQRVKDADAALAAANSSGDIVDRIATFFEHCSEDQANRVIKALSAVGLNKIETGIKNRQDATKAEKTAHDAMVASVKADRKAA